MSQLQSSSLPERSEVKEIFFPSGEYCGFHSFRVEEMNFVGGLGFPCDGEISMRQILVSDVECVKASREAR